MRAPWASILTQDNPLALLNALAGELGFGQVGTADKATRAALGIPDDLSTVRLAAGLGTTRILLIASDRDSEGREEAARVAARLSRTSPHLLWLLAIAIPARRQLALASWHAASPASPRIAALCVDCGSALASDLETLSTLANSMEGSDLETHARWIEILGREAISRRFFQALQSIVARLADGATGDGSPTVRREIALLHVSRLLFLAFLEDRGWLNADRRFLSSAFDRCMVSGGRFQGRVLDPLFFGTLNTPVQRRAPVARALGRIPFLNGGLFARSQVERRHRRLVMQDEGFGELFDQLLVRYRFTGREETDTWQEAAIDPEILGRAFESLMESGERRATGAFYTPLTVVSRVSTAALEASLAGHGIAEGALERLANDSCDERERALARRVLTDIRILDPACGSGAFLVYIVDRLTQLRARAGDSRATSDIRREVLARSIFGVDLNPTAVWLCELRLWLSLVMDHAGDDIAAVPPLPNLDHNIRCGDTLLGGDFALTGRGAGGVAVATLRTRYARATGPRKRSLGRVLDRLERVHLVAWIDARLSQVSAQRRSLVSAARGRDLFGGRRGSLAPEREQARQLRRIARDLRTRRRNIVAGSALPFAFAAQFPDAAHAGGFDVVLGNPPWIRLHHIPATMREGLRREFRVFREAAWVDGARTARAGTGFGSQVDVASLFIERSHQLLREGGVLALLVPSKLWRSLAGGGVRRLLTERSSLHLVEDWSAAPSMFDAATYPSIVVATCSAPIPAEPVRLSVHRARTQVEWRAPRTHLPLDDTAGSPWLTLPPDARAAFDRLSRAGVPLTTSGLGLTTLGVKCGCNEAFLVSATAGFAGVEVTDGVRRALLEPTYVRRVLRGEMVTRWAVCPSDDCIVFPHADDGRACERLPTGVRDWLLPWRARLEARTDARGCRPWWSLYRLDGSRCDRPRVVWADMGKSLDALVLEAGDRTVPLNTCYVLRARDLIDAQAVAALFNSAVVNAWVGAVAEPARGGYRRHFAWTMSRLPVPDDWARARDVLAPLGERAMRGDPPRASELMYAVLDAFRVRARAVAPLVEWTNHQ